MTFFLEFLVMGLLIGVWGALAGTGGGSILTPLLLVLFPGQSPEIITATSLSVVMVSALSSLTAYIRIGRTDLKTGITYGLIAVPWVILGVFGTAHATRGPFDALLGLVLLSFSASLFFSPVVESPPTPGGGLLRLTERRIQDRAGMVFNYRFRFRLGMLCSVVIGFMASFFGIGGGPFNVPVWIKLLKMPPHIAAATAPCMLLITSSTAVALHFFRGNMHAMADVVTPLIVGVLVGTQTGARLSRRLNSRALTLILSGFLSLISSYVLVRGVMSILH